MRLLSLGSECRIGMDGFAMTKTLGDVDHEKEQNRHQRHRQQTSDKFQPVKTMNSSLNSGAVLIQLHSSL